MARVDGSTAVVIGGGVTGLSSAWWLARSGVDVIMVERGVLGAEASGRNGGQTLHLHSPLGMEEQRLWPVLDEMLGYPTEWQPGRLDAAMDEETFEAKKAGTAPEVEMGFEVEFLDGDQVRELVPLASKRIVGGVYRHYGGHANPQRTVQAYAWAFQDLGGRIYQHHTVTGIRMEGDRVVGVDTDRGTFDADFVIDAAGPSTGMIAEMAGVSLPLAHARIEQIVTEPVPPMFGGNFIGNGLYGRQTRRGNLAYGGGPHEWIDVTGMSEPEKPSTPLIRNLARRLLNLYEEAGDLRMIRSWGGIVEQTPDSGPVIELLDRPRNFIVATMSGMGFGLSPAVGKAISDLVTKGEVSFADISELNVGRFKDVPSDWRERAGWVPSPRKD
jgi:sarcosine oxidase subunit beta